jgi:hypothetical protein
LSAGGRIEVRLRQPVFGIALVGTHDGIREGELVAGHEAADMIAMHVRDVDLVELARAGTQTALRLAKTIPRPGPNSPAAPVSIITSLLPVFTRYAFTDVGTGSARKARFRSCSTRSGLMLVRICFVGSGSTPSESAVISKSPSIMR